MKVISAKELVAAGFPEAVDMAGKIAVKIADAMSH